MSNLAGLHDREASNATAPDTWIVDTIALMENPIPITYPTSVNWIGRLNYGYEPNGTIPLPTMYNTFAAMCANYVAGSRNCRRWIIGNEPNFKVERPNGQPITPTLYAECYRLCRRAIRAVPGHENDEVLVACSGPWNADTKYPGNPDGDWIKYTRDVLVLLGDEWDGLAIHAYTHGYDVSLVTSTALTTEGIVGYYYNFLTYRDYCNCVPPGQKHKKAYLTEANGNGPWQAVGLIPAMLAEIDWWNHSGQYPQIQCVIFFRYSNQNDGYNMVGKDAVMAEYRQGVARNFMSPIPSPIPEPGPGPTPPPKPTPPAPVPDPIIWDPRLDARGCKLTTAPAGAATAWRLIEGRWYNKEEAQGRVNVFVTLLDENDQLAVGVPVEWYWQGDSDTKPSEVKSDPWLGHDYSLDFAMYEVAPSYGVQVVSGLSDSVFGMGLGTIENPQLKEHTAYSFVFKRMASQPQPPEPPIPPQPARTQYVIAQDGANLRAEPVTGAVIVSVPYGEGVTVEGSQMGSDGYEWRNAIYDWDKGWIRADLLSVQPPQPPQPEPPTRELVHPLPGAVITHHWGESAPEYSPGMWGHSGTDMGGKAKGTPIRAIADGIVTYVGTDPKGYGKFLQVLHDALEAYSFYGHCDSIAVAVGQSVKAGETIATLGSTGNSTGPHLHLEIRLANQAGTYQPQTPMPQGRVDPESWFAVYGQKL